MGRSKNYSSAVQFHHFSSLRHLQKSRRSFFAFLSLFLLFFFSYNGASMFFHGLPVPAKTPEVAVVNSSENGSGEPRNWVHSSSVKLSSSLILSVTEENPVPKSEKDLRLLHKSRNLVSLPNSSSVPWPLTRRVKKQTMFKLLGSKSSPKQFSLKVKGFFRENSCKIRFYMTWISSLDSFGDREFFAIEALFKSHPDGCLLIASNSMDSSRGKEILKPFLEKGFRVIAISPDFSNLFEKTVAESWLNRLRKGNVHPGGISLGQNLSNLLRLGLLYKFGGVYIDTDIIVLRSFKHLRNVIGAQAIDVRTKKWTRLNNAVMIFDKGHPLVYKFIEEFALTFDGNKWGHNGPYLVSRVVSRVTGRPGFNFTVLPPMAFYPVSWSRIGSLFRGPRYDNDTRLLVTKLKYIRSQSYAVHLWNKQSKGVKVEEGSIIRQIMSDSCVFCNSSSAEAL